MHLGKQVSRAGCALLIGTLLGAGAPDLVPGVASAVAAPRARGKVAESDKKKIAIQRCVDYSQDLDDDGMQLHLRNRCGIDLQCTASWEVVCQGEDATATHKGASAFGLADQSSNGAYVSAARCGEEGWRIRKVRWSCVDSEDVP